MEQQKLGLVYHRMSRDDRIRQVGRVLAKARVAYPVSEIAKLIGLKKSAYVQGLADELVELGIVRRLVFHRSRNIPTFAYRMLDEHRAEWGSGDE